MIHDSRKPKKDKNKSRKTFLIVSACVLTLALAAVAYFWISDSVQTTFLMEGKTALKGITVSGIPISDMTKEQAQAATANIPNDLLSKVEISINVEGDIHKFTAKDLGITTNYDDIINQAVTYAHTGTEKERKQAAADASKGKEFTVKVVAPKDKLEAVLLPLKTQLDKAPADATYTFMPWGYTSDNQPYAPDKQAIIQSTASGKAFTLPDNIVKIPDAEMPNPLRYEYWLTNHYVGDNYKPSQANVARFLYMPEVQGRSIDMESVINSIIGQVASGSYSEISAPVQALDPTVKLADIKKQTQLISSWTSSYESHYNYDRNWNVAKLSGIICGVVIQPGEQWSINKEAGNRTVSGGWRKAPGIENGGYTMQPGGGVCQISSTTYNAAIRCGLDTVSTHHSIKSAYMPAGMDATISSPDPDLKITNVYTTPIFIVSYITPAEKNVTVEIYGVPVSDPKYGGDIIIDYDSKSLGTFGTPVMQVFYNTPVAPDGNPVDPAKPYVYAENRLGETIQTYKIIKSLDGKLLDTITLPKTTWKPINGKTYVYGADPATLPPVDPNAPTPTPTV